MPPHGKREAEAKASEFSVDTYCSVCPAGRHKSALTNVENYNCSWKMSKKDKLCAMEVVTRSCSFLQESDFIFKKSSGKQLIDFVYGLGKGRRLELLL